MILYHGTNQDFGDIDLAKSKPNKDIGTERAVKNPEKTMSEQEQMKIDMVKNLALLLIEEQPQLTMEQALATVINSDTYQRLQRDATGLYHQSSRYVYSFLDSELKTGRVK